MVAGRKTAILYMALAFAAPLSWEVGVGIALMLTGSLSELATFMIGKLGFVIILALFLTIAGLWRACGFAGGPRPGSWGLLWPLWAAAGVSAVQGISGLSPIAVLSWLAVAFAVAFGEEGIFRGVMITILDPARPRRVVIITAILFGVIHLAGLLTPIDPRMILAQAVGAFGLGMVLGATRLLTGSIWPGLIAHGTLDFFGLIAGGGISGALAYSFTDIVYMLIGASVAVGWGVVLCSRLPPYQDAYARPGRSVA
jgi:membrane protease YdiL (CAAX protease family)